MSSYVTLSAFEAHQQDLVRAAEKSRIATVPRRRRFASLGPVLRSALVDRRSRRAAAAKPATAH